METIKSGQIQGKGGPFKSTERARPRPNTAQSPRSRPTSDPPARPIISQGPRFSSSRPTQGQSTGRASAQGHSPRTHPTRGHYSDTQTKSGGTQSTQGHTALTQPSRGHHDHSQPAEGHHPNTQPSILKPGHQGQGPCSSHPKAESGGNTSIQKQTQSGSQPTRRVSATRPAQGHPSGDKGSGQGPSPAQGHPSGDNGPRQGPSSAHTKPKSDGDMSTQQPSQGASHPTQAQISFSTEVTDHHSPRTSSPKGGRSSRLPLPPVGKSDDTRHSPKPTSPSSAGSFTR